MPIVKTNFGVGGSGLSAGHANPDSLADVLRGLVDDISGRTPATLAEDSATFTEVVSADATDPASAQTLVNELKASYNADMALVVALLNEIKGALNTASATSATVTKG
jgi:hypothetical protein